MRRLNLPTRTFLFSFVPVCLLLLSTFIAIHRVTHERIRKELREASYESGRLLDRAYADPPEPHERVSQTFCGT